MSDELKDFRYYADKAEEQLIDSQSYVKSTHSFDAATHKIGIAAVYAELAKAAPKVEPEPKYIVMTPVEAEMKAATDKKFATKLRRRSLTPEDRDVLRAFSETSEDRKQG
jgi:hypothetical protein